MNEFYTRINGSKVVAFFDDYISEVELQVPYETLEDKGKKRFLAKIFLKTTNGEIISNYSGWVRDFVFTNLQDYNYWRDFWEPELAQWETGVYEPYDIND